jgi:hypothetical protein
MADKRGLAYLVTGLFILRKVAKKSAAFTNIHATFCGGGTIRRFPGNKPIATKIPRNVFSVPSLALCKCRDLFMIGISMTLSVWAVRGLC